jgi:molybdopterin converting factor small subunit
VTFNQRVDRRNPSDDFHELYRAVATALEEIERSHPSLYRNLRDETGIVRRHLNVLVNTSHVRDRGGLDTALAPGDVVTILAAVSGG